MPQPQFQRVQINDLVRGVARLFPQAQLESRNGAAMKCRLELTEDLDPIAADPGVAAIVRSPITVLNAMDAMPQGGNFESQVRGAILRSRATSVWVTVEAWTHG